MKQIFTLFIFLLSVLGTQAQTVSDTLFGIRDHSREINKAIYSLDGRRLVTCGADRTVNMYESINWIPLGSYSHNEEVTHVAISRENSYVASVAKDNSIKVWSLDTGKVIFECAGQEGETTGLAIDMGVRFIYTTSTDGFVRIFDIRKRGELSRKFSVGASISSIALSHTGNIYLGMKNGEIKIMNYMGKQGKPIKAHTSEVTSLYYAFYKTNSLLISGSEDKTAKIWDVKTGKMLKTLTGHSWRINQVELSRNLQFALTASNDGFVKVWDVKTGKEIASIDKKGEAVKCVSINGDNTNIATTAQVNSGQMDYVVYIWDARLSEPVKPNPNEKMQKKGP